MKKISVIVPVYNVEKYLDKCLNSILNQTYKNFEVIIINDGSTDESYKIISKYEKLDSRFKCYNKENGGLSDARNYGLDFVTGDYLLFIDSDDYVDNNYFENIVNIANKEDIDLIKIKLIKVDEFGNYLEKKDGKDNSGFIDFEKLITLDYVEPACSYVYSTKFWKNNKFKFCVGRLHEDFGLIPEVVLKSKKIYYLDYYAYYYVQRENSIMSSNSNETLKKKAYDMLYQYDRLMSLKFDNVSTKDIKLYNDSVIIKVDRK